MILPEAVLLPAPIPFRMFLRRPILLPGHRAKPPPEFRMRKQTHRLSALPWECFQADGSRLNDTNPRFRRQNVLAPQSLRTAETILQYQPRHSKILPYCCARREPTFENRNQGIPEAPS